MTVRIIELIIVLIGLALTWLLFYRLPVMPNDRQQPAVPSRGQQPAVPSYRQQPAVPSRGPADAISTSPTTPTAAIPLLSVIIPARNEAQTLPLLLDDLQKQSWLPMEIICVDDGSDDATAQIARERGVRVISLHDKPSGWIGKSWACQNGADAAAGDALLFLDADVRLGPQALARLMSIYAADGRTISVQPYHRTEKPYEQLSLIFNLALVAANGMAIPKPLNVGLCGPIILISRQDYLKVDKHERVRNCVAEDVALGLQLAREKVPYRLFLGDEAFSFRMYGNGWRSLLQGWVKNQATGAAKTPLALLVMVFFWIASMASVPLQLVKHLLFGPPLWLAIYVFLYLAWILRLKCLSKKAGLFQNWAVWLFPVPVLTFLGVFVVSMVKKVLRLKVTWKGRSIDPEGKSCR